MWPLAVVSPIAASPGERIAGPVAFALIGVDGLLPPALLFPSVFLQIAWTRLGPAAVRPEMMTANDEHDL